LDTTASSLVITPPDVLNQMVLVPAEEDAQETLIDSLAGAFDENFSFAPSEPVPGLNALRADFAATTLPDATSAFIMVVELDEGFALVLAIDQSDDPAAFEQTVIAIAQSFEVGTFARAGDPTGQLPILALYQPGNDEVEWSDAIAELERLDLIPPGGALLYNQSVLIGAVQDGLIFNPDSAWDQVDVVMAGRISLRPKEDADFAICGLVSRTTGPATDVLSDFLIVGPTSDGRIVALENDASANERHLIERASPVDFHDPQHILYLVRQNRLTVFVNGEALIEDWPLQLPGPDDATLYETVRVGTQLDPGCVMTGVWAYGLPTGE
ncbi:MAG: hypothetical protein K8J31_22580, partial [Anaerolineae bacterium]|nr:hypothetical protein [Anaerolineae bacterium]